MFIRSLVFALSILVGSLALGGEGKLSRSFTLATDIQTIADWLNSHHDEVAESTHCTIISRKGDLVRVTRDTMKGEFEFVLREKITDNSDGGTYSLSLVKCYKGNMTKDDIIVRFTKFGSGTKIEVFAEAVVDNPRIRNIEVVAGLSVSARGFERMMKSRF